MKWIKEHWFGISIFLLLLVFPTLIITDVVHYNLEHKRKIYVEWTVYDGLNSRHYKGTYDIVGDNFGVRNYWTSAGKYSGSYRVVSIVDGNAWMGYFEKQSVCIYTGLNDVEVNKIKIIE